MRACTEVRAFCLYVSPKPRGDRQQSPVSRALKVNAILAVCVKRSLTKRRAHAVVLVKSHYPYHLIFVKAG
nr:hypothetical protein [Salmonella bongori serovar 66:z65:-]